MSSDRQQRITGIFHSAIERGASERVHFLDGACAGDDHWRQMLQLKIDEFEHGRASALSLAEVCATVGQKERALELLEVAFKERDFQLAYVGIAEAFDTMKTDPRFQDLLRRIGLPPGQTVSTTSR